MARECGCGDHNSLAAPSVVGAAPDDRFTTSRGNVIAAARWAQEVGSLKHTSKGGTIRTYLTDYMPEVELTNDLVILGGSHENTIARSFLDALNAGCPGCEVLYDDGDETRNVLRLSDHSGTVFDVSYPWLSEAAAREPTYDYGLLVVWLNPFSGERRRAILCAGFTAAGTKAATSFFFDHVVPNLRRYATAGRRAWPCFAIAWEMSLTPGGSAIPKGIPRIVQLPDRT